MQETDSPEEWPSQQSVGYLEKKTGQKINQGDQCGSVTIFYERLKY